MLSARRHAEHGSVDDTGSTLLLLLCCATGFFACSPVSAFDLQLVPDPDWTDAPQLLALAQRVRVAVDSPQGLYPASAARREGQLILEDVDADGSVELVTEFDVVGLDHLPLLRLERGGLPDVHIDVRFDGLAAASQEVVAGGSVRGLSFEPETVIHQDVLFKPRMRLLPPRVTQVIPSDGARETLVGTVYIVFPKQMNAESLRAPGTITLSAVEGNEERAVPAREIRIQFLPGIELPTTVELQLNGFLAPGLYRVRVSQRARDLDGRALDQVPAQPDNQAFSSQFEVAATQQTMATEACPLNGACGEVDVPCGLAGSRPVCASGLVCVDGACIPEGCPPSCLRGMVCDPALGICVMDCREYGLQSGCAADRPVCGADGVCRTASD